MEKDVRQAECCVKFCRDARGALKSWIHFCQVDKPVMTKCVDAESPEIAVTRKPSTDLHSQLLELIEHRVRKVFRGGEVIATIPEPARRTLLDSDQLDRRTVESDLTTREHAAVEV